MPEHGIVVDGWCGQRIFAMGVSILMSRGRQVGVVGELTKGTCPVLVYLLLTIRQFKIKELILHYDNVHVSISHKVRVLHS